MILCIVTSGCECFGGVGCIYKVVEWFLENRSSQSELGIRKRKLGHEWTSGNMGREKANKSRTARTEDVIICDSYPHLPCITCSCPKWTNFYPEHEDNYLLFPRMFPILHRSSNSQAWPSVSVFQTLLHVNLFPCSFILCDIFPNLMFPSWSLCSFWAFSFWFHVQNLWASWRHCISLKCW